MKFNYHSALYSDSIVNISNSGTLLDINIEVTCKMGLNLKFTPMVHRFCIETFML